MQLASKAGDPGNTYYPSTTDSLVLATLRLTGLWRSSTALNQYLAKLAKEFDYDKITSYMMRHSFAINAMLHLTPLSVLQSWLGHSTLSSTSIYTEIFEPDTLTFIVRIDF